MAKKIKEKAPWKRNSTRTHTSGNTTPMKGNHIERKVITWNSSLILMKILSMKSILGSSPCKAINYQPRTG